MIPIGGRTRLLRFARKSSFVRRNHFVSILAFIFCIATFFYLIYRMLWSRDDDDDDDDGGDDTNHKNHLWHDHHALHSSLDRLHGSTDRCAAMSSAAVVTFRHFITRITVTLAELNIGYFLCYDTLWIALQRGQKIGQKSKSPPLLRIADACLTLCVRNEDLMRLDGSMLERRFHQRGIDIRYNHGDGVYTLKPSTLLFSADDHIFARKAFLKNSIITGSSNDSKSESARSQIPLPLPSVVSTSPHPLESDIFAIHSLVYVFEQDSVHRDSVRRIGWKNRLLPSGTMCKQLHCFPERLIEKPLPEIELFPRGAASDSFESDSGAKFKFPIPRENIEIFKYFYPDTWWKLASGGECER